VSGPGPTDAKATRFSRRVPRARIDPPVDVFPIHAWKLETARFTGRFAPQVETIYALGNGYLGLRGDIEEGAPTAQPGVFLNGFYESWPIVYGESAYGFARTGQTIVNATDGKVIKLYVDDEPFELAKANILEWHRTLDLRAGTLDRTILFETPAGKQISLATRRMVSITHRHLALISYEVSVRNATAHFTVASELFTRHGETEGDDDDPRRSSGFDGRVLEPVCQRAEGRRAVLLHRTRNSGLTLACGMDHEISTEASFSEHAECGANRAEVVFSIDAGPEQPFQLTKYLAYHFSGEATAEELAARAERTLRRNREIGEQRLFEEQRERLDDFWEHSDVEIRGGPAIQQSVRFNLFQVFQATARAEGYGVPAKGLSGQGYEGHYFWDAEIYVLPYLIYTAPRVARNLLQFRYRMLDQARERARELGHRGALFPWRTISGEEASAYYAAGTAQYHIDADIVYALRKYVQASGDARFLCESGAELIVETARLWMDLGFFSEQKGGAFCINGVTGPDEYTAVVDNNRYTNMMARENLLGAVAAVETLQHRYPDDLRNLVRKTGFQASELEQWRRAAERMHLPVDEKTGIHPQDDDFLEKEVWDCAATPPEKYPLLLHYHPLVLYRHQVIKQADVVMAMFLVGHEFSAEEKKRNFDYYDPLTTRDSSLSSCIQSIVASEVGYPEKAFDYFLDAALVDLADIGGNVTDGVHIASAGGTWMALVYGFGGMRDHEREISFHPRLPADWEGLRFRLELRGQRVEVDMDREGTSYRLLEGSSLLLRHEDEEFQLLPDAPARFPATAG
jgi:alpha,alpha-trehalose phosphorylase